MNLSLNLSRCAVVTAIVGVNVFLSAQAPGKPVSTVPVTPFSEVQRGYAALKGNILKSADRMPAESYSYKPTPEVRTYARVVNHITEAQWHSCGTINGTAAEAQPKVPEETADKATIVAALNASFAECDKAFASLSEANLLQMLPAGTSTRSRLGLAWGTVSHDNEQYATLALYLRLKGLVPPSSEK
ncbi:DinB family protein [Granulicella aggregans]|uniref:DinB family protein n=1 Tax=Granulicella aggregans TaxID=474949 RepID=UPI0021DFB56D|nr:DinB family protein [Granulicella aggregans]